MQANAERLDRLISGVIKRFSLDLAGLTVLTEAATGIFVVTPIIAARAGADVIAIAKDSNYGTAGQAIDSVKEGARRFGVKGRINFVTNLNREIIHRADIVTNLGAVRPINQEFIRAMKATAVISLMCEGWEVRNGDVDIDACRRRRISVMGTNEDAPELGVFEFVGPLCLKMIFNAGLEIYQNNFVVISGDKFGRVISEWLKKNGAGVTNVGLCDIGDGLLDRLDFERLDAIVVADYTSRKTIIGTDGIITSQAIKNAFPEAMVIQFSGNVNTAELRDKKICFYPDREVGAFKMGMTFGDLGPKPTVDLHAAGLKVGEIMARCQISVAGSAKIREQYDKFGLCDEII